MRTLPFIGITFNYSKQGVCHALLEMYLIHVEAILLLKIGGRAEAANGKVAIWGLGEA